MAGDSGSQDGGGGTSYPGGAGKPGVIELVFAASTENDEYTRNPAENTGTQLPSGGAQQQHSANLRKRASATGDMEIPAAGGHGGTHGRGCTDERKRRGL